MGARMFIADIRRNRAHKKRANQSRIGSPSRRRPRQRGRGETKGLFSMPENAFQHLVMGSKMPPLQAHHLPEMSIQNANTNRALLARTGRGPQPIAAQFPRRRRHVPPSPRVTSRRTRGAKFSRQRTIQPAIDARIRVGARLQGHVPFRCS